MKLRACKGSCGGYHEYQVDRESYVTLEKQVGASSVYSRQKTRSGFELFSVTIR